MPTVFSANRSSVLVDGEAIEGLQSLAFRVVTEREDIRAVGSDEPASRTRQTEQPRGWSDVRQSCLPDTSRKHSSQRVHHRLCGSRYQERHTPCDPARINRLRSTRNALALFLC